MSSIYTVFCLVTETGCNGWSMPPDGIKTIFHNWLIWGRAHPEAKVLSYGRRWSPVAGDHLANASRYFRCHFVPKFQWISSGLYALVPPTSIWAENGSTRTSPVWIESYQLLLRHHQWSMPRLFRDPYQIAGADMAAIPWYFPHGSSARRTRG